jgi:hypothetical protein
VTMDESRSRAGHSRWRRAATIRFEPDPRVIHRVTKDTHLLAKQQELDVLGP